jgi:hypothetical protein
LYSSMARLHAQILINGVLARRRLNSADRGAILHTV